MMPILKPSAICLLVALALPAVAQQVPPAPAPTSPTEAQALYEQVNALMLIRGVGLTQVQLRSLLAVLQNLQTARETYRQRLLTLYQQQGEVLKQAVEASLKGQATAQQMAAAQTALAALAQIESAVQQAYDTAAAQWDVILSPPQDLLVETPGRAVQRRQAQALLGGASSLPDYLAQQADLMRALSPAEYELVRYWQAQRLAAMLRPTLAPGFDYLAARVLEILDTIYLADASTYVSQRATLAAMIGQYLGLREVTQPGYFLWDQVELLLGSDQSVQVVQQLLGEQPAPIPSVEATAAETVKSLGALANQAKVLGLADDLGLTGGQLRAMQPLVQQAESAIAGLAAATATRLAGNQTALHQIRDVLLVGSALAPEQQQAWTALREALSQDRQKALAAAAALVRTRDLLSMEQAALVEWPVALAGGPEQREAQLRELRAVAGQIRRGYAFFAGLRFQKVSLYTRIRVQRTRELLAEYLPEDSPRWPQAEAFVLDLVSEARSSPLEAWEQVWPRLATRLMVGLGAVPGPESLVAVARPISWERYASTLTGPEAGQTLARIAEAKGA